MIVFIVPLKSKQISKDWTRVSKLVERCIGSLCNQTSGKFKVIVVCHEQPDCYTNNPSIHFAHADFSPPQIEGENAVNLMDKDKNKKMWLGVEYASKFDPSHIMFVDADDCVSCHIAEFVSHHPHANGWFFDSGYVYKDGSKRVFYKKKDFYWLSGTSHIIKYALLQDEALASIYMSSDSALHQHIVEVMEERNTPLCPLPFPGAVYIAENGENIYQGTTPKPELSFFFFKELLLNYPRKFRTLIASQELNKSILNEFSLARIPHMNAK